MGGYRDACRRGLDFIVRTTAAQTACHCLGVDPALDDQGRQFLESCRVAHLATVDAHGRPHVLPVCFAVLEGVIYTPIDLKPKRGSDPRSLARVRHIQANPDICLIADRYDDDWSRLAWLQVRGTAELLAGGAERDAAVAALRQRYWQYEAMDLATRPVIAIRPERIVRWSAASP